MNHAVPTPSRRPGTGHRSLAGLAAAALAVGLAITGAPPASAAGAFFCADGTQPYATVAEVEGFPAGEAVTGLSVTSGTAPEQFTGSYLGFIDDGIGIGKDMLLFRLSSPVIDGTGPGTLKPAGIWAGMSGSPVYTKDGRLIGAVAYSLNSDNLPIAGVTPAEYMKSIGTTAVGTSAKVRVSSTNLKVSGAGARVAGTTLVGGTLSQVRTVNVAGGTGSRLNAFANRTLARTPRTAKSAGVLRSRSFLPAAAVSSRVTAPLVAGGSVAALYGSGDIVAGAVGTVTAVCDTTVWAFGHPLDYAGKTSLYLANASTAMIVPDATGAYGSYKQVSEFGAPVGMITQDRSVGIRGTIGAVNGFGINVLVQDPSGAQVGAYHGDLASQDLSGAAIAYLVGSAALDQLDAYGSGTGEVTWTIAYRRANGDTGELTNTQLVADAHTFPDTVGTPAAEDAWAIASNQFENVTITGIDVTLKLLSEDSVAYEVAGTQVLTRGGWASLDGSRLKAGATYSFRPAYQLRTNGRLGGTVAGAPVRVKLSSSARKRGAFTVAAANQSEQVCETDSQGTVYCEEWDNDLPEEYADFDELVGALDELPLATEVSAELRYKLRKGYRARYFDWTAPGVVTGGTRDGFSIRS